MKDWNAHAEWCQEVRARLNRSLSENDPVLGDLLQLYVRTRMLMLSPQERKVVATIFQFPDTPLGALAYQSRIAPNAFSSHVCELEKRGYVERYPSPANPRTVFVRIADATLFDGLVYNGRRYPQKTEGKAS